MPPMPRDLQIQAGRPAGAGRGGPQQVLALSRRAQRPFNAGRLADARRTTCTANAGLPAPVRRRWSSKGVRPAARLSGRATQITGRLRQRRQRSISQSRVSAPSGCARPPGAREPRSDQSSCASRGRTMGTGCRSVCGPDLEPPTPRGPRLSRRPVPAQSNREKPAGMVGQSLGTPWPARAHRRLGGNLSSESWAGPQPDQQGQ